MKLINFKSEQPLTEFAPSWNWIVAEDSLSNSVDFNKIKNIILENESEIISKNKHLYDEYNEKYNVKFDGGTGLGSNSLTSRSPFFNFLTWDYEEIKTLKQDLRIKYKQFLDQLHVYDRKVWIQSWANVMRNNEKIEKHIHSSHPLTWLGGHITVSCNETSTFYLNPMETQEGNQIYESKNEVGKLTLFQNNLPHYTNTHYGNEERISIAFDIIPDQRYHQLEDNRKQLYIEF